MVLGQKSLETYSGLGAEDICFEGTKTQQEPKSQDSIEPKEFN